METLTNNGLGRRASPRRPSVSKSRATALSTSDHRPTLRDNCASLFGKIGCGDALLNRVCCYRGHMLSAHPFEPAAAL